MHFTGRAKKINDYDIPRIGAMVNCGEDEIHAFMEVEAGGVGFDSAGRPKMLFEPHLFYRQLGPGAKRDEAVKAGLAYKDQKYPYPKESYTRLSAAMKIDDEKAIMSASWGLTQILGQWYKDLGYTSPVAMVEAFADDEANHLEATIMLLKQWKVDDDLAAHRWDVVAKAWNGPDYARHGYHTKLAAAYKKWQGIKDTVWPPKDYVPPVPAPVATEVTKLPAGVNAELPATPAKDAVIVVTDQKPGGSIVVPTPTTKPVVPTPAVPAKKTGLVAIIAIVASLIAGLFKYFGG